LKTIALDSRSREIDKRRKRCEISARLIANAAPAARWIVRLTRDAITIVTITYVLRQATMHPDTLAARLVERPEVATVTSPSWWTLRTTRRASVGERRCPYLDQFIASDTCPTLLPNAPCYVTLKHSSRTYLAGSVETPARSERSDSRLPGFSGDIRPFILEFILSAQRSARNSPRTGEKARPTQGNYAPVTLGAN